MDRSNFIARDGRGNLGDSERRALEMQHKNQRTSAGSWDEVERRQAARAVGMATKLAPRANWADTQRGPTGRGPTSR
jgi:hypothetical protein